MARAALMFPLLPAKAGIQRWIPAFAGMSGIMRAGALATAVTALGLSGCGRSGPLELPPGPATSAPGAQLTTPTSAVPGSAQDAAAARNGFDARGNPVAPVGEKKSFILDPLLQ